MQVRTPRTLIRARNCKFAKFFFQWENNYQSSKFSDDESSYLFLSLRLLFFKKTSLLLLLLFSCLPIAQKPVQVTTSEWNKYNVGQTIFCSVQSFKPWTRNLTNKFYYDNKVIYKWRTAQWKQSDIKIININHKHSF